MCIGMLRSRCTESDGQDNGNLKLIDDIKGSDPVVFVIVCYHCQFSVCNVKFYSNM